MLVIYLSDKGLISKICTDFFNSEKKKYGIFLIQKKKNMGHNEAGAQIFITMLFVKQKLETN